MMRIINCLVTGGTSGVGAGIARALAREGARVTLVSSDSGRGAAAAAAIRQETGNDAVDWIAADLSSLRAVRTLADAVLVRYGRLHVLSCNAARLTMRRELTEDGLESTFAVNYLSHFLLANLLAGSLRAAAPSRVLTVSGTPGMIARVRPDFGDLRDDRGFSPLRATLRAATAKVLFTLELARRFSGTGVVAHTFHPGMVRSGMPTHLPLVLRVPVGLGSLLFARESATGAWLATSPQAQESTGGFFVRRTPVAFTPPYDAEEAGRQLWELSARLCGLS